MTPIASHITAFFRERLPIEQAASPHTCSNYAYTFMLLFDFASKRLNISPSGLHRNALPTSAASERAGGGRPEVADVVVGSGASRLNRWCTPELPGWPG